LLKQNREKTIGGYTSVPFSFRGEPNKDLWGHQGWKVWGAVWGPWAYVLLRWQGAMFRPRSTVL